MHLTIEGLSVRVAALEKLATALRKEIHAAPPENDRSEWSRYQIRIIMEADCKTVGAVVGASDNKAEAKKKARELGSAYHYGVAIVDIEDGIVDAGECDGEKLVFDLDECTVRSYGGPERTAQAEGGVMQLTIEGLSVRVAALEKLATALRKEIHALHLRITRTAKKLKDGNGKETK